MSKYFCQNMYDGKLWKFIRKLRKTTVNDKQIKGFFPLKSLFPFFYIYMNVYV